METMDWEESYFNWSIQTDSAATRQDAFKAGWEAAIKRTEEPWGTLEGAERYLEARDRESFLDLRRAKIEFGIEKELNHVIDALQDRWIAYGEAWALVNRLLPAYQAIKNVQIYGADRLGKQTRETEGEGDWPWCEACRSYHHPNNPTCFLKTAQKR